MTEALGRRWAELLARVFEVDPFRCLRCGGTMRIVALILERNAIDAILVETNHANTVIRMHGTIQTVSAI